MVKVFVDGSVGTTGLEIVERLSGRPDITLHLLDEARRKDAAARADALAEADIAILCLPDEAAREAVALAETLPVRFIDASTAHRVDPDWTYGFPELAPGHAARIAGARRVSNPGCYPTGFLALVAPLVREGLLPAGAPLTVHATSGYSGGGKAMIAAFEEAGVADATDTAFHTYGLSLSHKHVPEMQRHAGLTLAPIFAPAVARTYRGMIVEVPLHLALCSADATPARIQAALEAAYAGSPVVEVARDQALDRAALRIEHVAGTDRLALFVFSNPAAGHVRLVAALDNLGKGAGGAAVQNLNLMAGLPETAGLRL
ncbi:N-acetyl-gamma-glutamyl-phosphate reductase [Sphingomonas morindae]|uniref:N-acetyl-gamma-glutamyl-phosphate reductase n=1 Tax=Sphingomonas morindae TaxID=1541170 RepID=A0ABY4X5C9_9SPHN|nr:N-acetyl-gamma-glutamyl-phosphate reductase [Sphingomonas morindae]USI72098.1 N-acetyl-gamma-glutamyl-phosphate reductase [Sphingomonas morindae]